MKGVHQTKQDDLHTIVSLLDDDYMLGTMLSNWGEKGERINMNDTVFLHGKFTVKNLRMYLSGFVSDVINYLCNYELQVKKTF